MKNIITFLFIPTLFLLIGCIQDPVAPHPTPIVADTDLCPAVEQHLQSLCDQDTSKNSTCCNIVAHTKRNKTFTQFCIETQNAGIALNTKCLSQITDCSAINICTGSEPSTK